MTGEPETFVDLFEGRRLVVLSWKSDESGCVFHDRGRGCRVHRVRPTACRTYPYEWDDQRRHLTLHPRPECASATGIGEGPGAGDREEFERDLDERSSELAAHVAVVSRWNRRARRRRLARRFPESRSAYLAFITSHAHGEAARVGSRPRKTPTPMARSPK